MIQWRDTGGSRHAAIRLELARRAIVMRPESASLHYALAAECFYAQDFDAGIAAFERGMELKPADADNLVGYVKALLARGRPLDALNLLDRYEDDKGGPVELLVQRGDALRHIGRLDAASDALRRSLELCPTHIGAAMTLSSLLSSRKDWAGLVNFAEEQVQRNAVTMPVMQAWVEGLAGLGRNREAARLLDFDALVRVQTVDPPESFASLDAFNAALVRDLMSGRKTRLSNVPRLEMTGGVAVEDLETESSPAMAALFALLRRSAEDYLREGSRPDIVRAIVPEAGRLDAWAVILGPGDTQDPHYHVYSSVAGVYYVSAPDELFANGGKDGCLEIPLSPSNATKPLVPPQLIQPLPGRLVLFPGYFFHGTTPMKCAGERISIAFDIVPESSTLHR